MSSIRVWRICSRANLRSLRLHLKPSHLLKCLQQLSSLGKIESLHFRLDSADELRKIDFNVRSFSPLPRLKNAVVYGWSCSVRCHPFLNLIGAQLENLKFMESYPFDLFSVLSTDCPLLLDLTVEGGSGYDRKDLPNSNLQTVSAMNPTPSIVSFTFRGSALPTNGFTSFFGLRRLELLDWTASPQLLVAALKSLPSQLLYLEINILGELLHSILLSITTSAPNLRSLIVRIRSSKNSQVVPLLEFEDVTLLAKNCFCLNDLQFIGGYLSLSAEVLVHFATMKRLTKLTIPANDVVIESLSSFLNQAEYLEELKLLIVDSDDAIRLEEMEDRLQSICEMFPAIRISLQDGW